MKAMAMIPTYNEALNIENLLKEILQQGAEIAVVVVDDNSPDGTAAIVEKMRQKDQRIHLIIRYKEKGRGTAGLAGFKYALRQKADLVIEMDADFSHSPSYIPFFLSQMDDCDLLLGSRLIAGGGEKGRHLLRKWITRWANFYIRLVLGLPYHDCTSGYRIFRRQVLEAISLEEIFSTGPSIVEEILYKAHRHGFRIKEAPYILEERKAGESTFNWRIMLETLLMMVKIRWRYRSYPKQMKRGNIS